MSIAMMLNSKAIFPAIGIIIFSAVALPAVSQSQTLPDAAINRPSQPIKGQYIVVFKDSVKDVDREVANLNRGQSMRVLHVYKNAIKGFAAQIPDVVVNALKRNPNIEYIEQDMTVSVNAVQSPVGQWGLSRIDQNTRPLDDAYSYDKTGTGVTAYIIDTGILETHADFSGRMRSGYSSFTGGTTDCNGHGTHVAGTVGGTTWGVAKGVTLVPVRVLDCAGSGSWSGVAAGVDWVVGDHADGVPAVANMSLGGGASTAVDSAVRRGIADGITFVVAAGNSNADACFSSPARVPDAVTVGATTSSDARASYSNFGTCLDIFAPGSSIRSAWYTSNTATNTISGTSMASPHVAGVAALFLASQPTATPADVTKALVDTSLLNLVTSAGTGSPNRLLKAPLNPNAPPPTVTGSASNRTSSSATLNATLHPATSATAEYGFCYVRSTSIDPRWGNGSSVVCTRVGTQTNSVTSVLPFSLPISGLSSRSSYRVRSYTLNADGVAYGPIISFSTL